MINYYKARNAILLFFTTLIFNSYLAICEATNSSIDFPASMVDCGPIDTDNDGIFDGCDLDDDNDGILDSNEGFNCSKTSNWYEITWAADYVFESFLTADIKVRVTMKEGDTFWDGTYPFYGTMDGTCNDFVSTYSPLGGEDALNIALGFQADSMATAETEFSVQFLDPLNNPITLSNTVMHIGGIGEDNGGLGISSQWDFQGPGTITEMSSLNDFSGINNSVLFDNIGSNVGAISNCGDGKGAGTIRVDGNVSAFAFTVKMFDEFGNVNFTAGDNLSLIFEICSQWDTDNDGVANHLDIDSDGDGCPDAIEGSDIFLMSSLNGERRLLGGVDLQGVPTVAGSFGQDLGTATDILITSVECDFCSEQSSAFSDSDNDGIGDLCDFDDDNDGILDGVELGCLEVGEIIWDHNAAGGTSLAGVPASNISSIITSVDDISFGDGFDYPTSVNEFVLHGSDANVYSVAKSGNEYVQVGFIVNEPAYISLVFHGLVEVAQLGSAAGEYKITTAISDDGFTTFDYLYKDGYISAPVATPYEVSYNELRQPHLLEPGKHYTIRLFLYDEQNVVLPDNTLAFDDLKITLATTCNSDADRDGLSNQIDLDSDNDGIPDLVEAMGVDMDGNGIVDGVIDSDGDRIPDYADADFSTCILGDGNIPQDGICDSVQGGPDADFDGIQDSDDMDKNGDGILNIYDLYDGGVTIGQPDSDGDSLVDYLDLDSDNDGIPDVVEAGGTDVNGDGLADGYLDADNDGLNDHVDGYLENTFVVNTNNALIKTGPDTDGDGIPNSYPNKDFDNDGFLNHLDLDADNDGIPDVIEAHGTNTSGDGRAEKNYIDIDEDGLGDFVDGDSLNVLLSGSDILAANSSNALQLTGPDADLDGAPDSYPEGDTDGDGLLDWMDLDSDNDGIPDIVEAYGADDNGDGFVDNFDPATNSFLPNTELDKDGYSNFYDSDIDNDGIVGDPGAVPLLTTSIDADENGAPDSGIIGGNFDLDNFPNHLDLDADNDGILDIIEAGMPDTDTNGMADDALTNDPDKNGWSNSFDGNNGGTSTITTTDSDTDGIPETYPTFNIDNTTMPNFLDIDSDDDGIVDNTEAQLTNPFLTYANLDSDLDGIDDSYDGFNGFGGEGIKLVNTDRFDLPDFLDTDSDNDGELDILEGHDTNGDNVIDASDSPIANTGIGGTADVDGDGLLDGFDNNITSPDPTNNLLAPVLHNDVDDPGGDRDWREGNCQLCQVNYAIQDGSNNLTTSIKTDPLTGKNILNTDLYGKVRLTKYCEFNGWRYYYNPAAPSQALFAIDGTQTDLDLIQYIEIRVGQNSNLREAGDVNAYTRIMNRDWFVQMKSTQVDPMSIRFYFPGTDYGINGYQASQTNAIGYGLSGSPEIRWWKTTDWDLYDPETINADATNLVNQNGYIELTPSTSADKYTGLAAIDGTAADIGNAKNYMQFDGLMNFSGGTAGFGILGSALPVELTQFNGLIDECKVHLSWTAAQTDLNGYYEVEWSSDGEDFELIDVLPRKHSFTATQSYLFTHQTTYLRNYYRLKMMDNDGQYTYSDVIFMRTSCDKQYDMMIYPNPVGIERPKIQVEYFSRGNEAKFTIFNLVGNVVNELFIDSAKHEWNVKEIDVSDLPSGTYYIFFENNEQVVPFTIQE